MDVKVQRNRKQVVAAVALVIAGATGRDSRFADVGIAVLTRIGNALLSQIQQDFLVKSRHGVGRDGIRWPELSPETILRRRVGPKDEKAVREKLKELRERAYRDELARLRSGAFSSFQPRAFGVDDDKLDNRLIKRARAYAKELAESAAKAVRREVLSAREVDILRDTGAMFRAFTPGVGDQQSWEGEQVFDVGYGQVTVGNREKPWHQLGGPHLPSRPSWPIDGTIPDAWWPAITLAAERGLRDAMFLIVREGRI